MSLHDSLERIVRALTGDFRFERVYPAVVERVGDDAVDVMPDDAVVRGMGLQRIPMPTIDPTTQLVPEPGCRCLLGFVQGDPKQPTIVAWEYAKGSASVRLDGGERPIARKGDLVEVVVGATLSIAGTASGATTAPGPVVTPVPLAPFSFVATMSGPVYGSPTTGAAKVKA